MFFSICQHYDDEYSNYLLYKDEDKECFICFEIRDINDLKPIKLNQHKIYIRTCKCSSYVHEKCLNKWLEKDKSCPICRKKVTHNIAPIFIILTYLPNGTNVCFYIKYVAKTIFKNIIKIILLTIIIFPFVEYIMLNYHLILYSRYEILNKMDNYNNYYKYNKYNITL